MEVVLSKEETRQVKEIIKNVYGYHTMKSFFLDLIKGVFILKIEKRVGKD